MELMGLSQYENMQAKSLSGGNKRKLSAAIALVGDPWLLYMVSVEWAAVR
jgi:ABC-type multidrug transport system ATPase subunit